MEQTTHNLFYTNAQRSANCFDGIDERGLLGFYAVRVLTRYKYYQGHLLHWQSVASESVDIASRSMGKGRVPICTMGHGPWWVMDCRVHPTRRYTEKKAMSAQSRAK